MTPTREQMLAEVRAKCVEANPEIDYRLCGECSKGYQIFTEKCSYCGTHGTGKRTKPILRLADVLLALAKAGLLFAVDQSGNINEHRCGEFMGRYSPAPWSLPRDSWDEQDDPTVAFIYQLLCAKS